MEIVKGNFGKDKEDLLLKDAVLEGIEQAGWNDTKGGRFFLIMDTEEQMSFVTNEKHPAEVVLMLQVVNQAIVSTQ